MKRDGVKYFLNVDILNKIKKGQPPNPKKEKMGIKFGISRTAFSSLAVVLINFNKDTCRTSGIISTGGKK